MSNLPQVFKSSEFGELKILVISGKEYFPATVCATILGYTNPRDAISRHCKGVVKHDVLTEGGNQAMNFIPEGDLYRLIIRSKLPAAERFEKWVFDDVLPTIRKTGGYVSNDDLFIETYLPHADEQTQLLFKATLENVRSLNAKIKEQEPKVESFDRFINGENLQTMGDVAKVLGTGRTRLFRFLREKGVFMPKGRVPYQRFIDAGYFKVKETPGHNGFNNVQTYVTAKGVEFIHRLMAEDKEIA